jgi:hypothetical protein
MKISQIDLFRVDLPYSSGVYKLSVGGSYTPLMRRLFGSPPMTASKDAERAHLSAPRTSLPMPPVPRRHCRDRASPTRPRPASGGQNQRRDGRRNPHAPRRPGLRPRSPLRDMAGNDTAEKTLSYPIVIDERAQQDVLTALRSDAAISRCWRAHTDFISPIID